MKTTTKIHNSIILLLCLCILGFFANWAHNDYGLKLVGISLLLISCCFAGIAFHFIRHKPIYRESFLILYSLLLLLAFFNKANLPEAVFIFTALVGLFGPTLFIPLWITVTERKQTNKTPFIEYYFAIFLSFFCLGNYYKIFHLSGAAQLTVCGALLIVPVIIYIVRILRFEIKQFPYSTLARLFLHLFVSLNILGYLFLTQHWPGGKFLVYGSFAIHIFLLTCLLFMKIKKLTLAAWWKSVFWSIRISFICLSITSLHYILLKNKIAPGIYSSTYPPALQQFWEKSNQITKQGIENDKKADVYYDNYMNFLNNREAAQQQNNHP